MAKEKKEEAAVNTDKLKALQAAMEKIEKSYGKGAIMTLGNDHIENIEVIPTGSIGLNAALGVGGYPRGRVVEIYGPESSGKTTLAIHAIAEAQKMGGIAAFIDAEHAFDRFYAQKLGVDIDNLLVSQPDSGEQALEIAEQLIRSAAVDIIVIDSVAALTPKAEIEGEMGDSKMGLQARLMSQALRKLTAAISKTKTSCIFINQLREKIGVMFGNPETTTGGNALKFYASVRIDIRRISTLKDGDDVKGTQVRVKVVKNKVAPPFRKAEFDIMFGEGISRAGEIIDLGSTLNIIKKSGSWFSYGDTKLAQGRDAAKQCIIDNPELADELEQQIFEKLKGSDVPQRNLSYIMPDRRKPPGFLARLVVGCGMWRKAMGRSGHRRERARRRHHAAIYSNRRRGLDALLHTGLGAVVRPALSRHQIHHRIGIPSGAGFATDGTTESLSFLSPEFQL